jgi:serine/threonine-protein kinase
MELVDGQPLSALLRGGQPLDPEVVRDLMAQAADAIGAAHRAGIVHRDLKPANLLVTPRDRKIKITDFGIARASDGLGLTGTGQVMGTPQYLSPEQARGSTATPASDVYSLGVVAFECLTGHRPFDAESPVATALAHLNDPVPDLPANIPADLAAIVRRALSKDPAQRYADGAAFAAALRDPATAVASLPPDDDRTQVFATPPPPVPAPVPPLSPDPMADPEPLPLEPEPRSPWPIVLLVGALVAAIVLIVLVVTSGGNDDDPDAADTGSTAPTSSAPTTESSEPSEPTSSAPERFGIDEGDYVGRNVDDVVAELRRLGLEVDLRPIDNPGDEEADTVSSVSPTTGLVKGSSVTVEYFREPEPTSEPPSETTTPSQSPSPSQGSPPATPSGSSSPAQESQSSSAEATTPAASASSSPSASATALGRPAS